MDDQKRKVKTGLYLRLSEEDGDKAESNSISNQRDLLRAYAAKAGLQVIDEYVDDGYTGTNFERPGFKRMMDDAKKGRIDCICVKDLSRLGRNYIETGRYIEKVFPFMGIRFLAVNDHYDSAEGDNGADSIIIPFKNLINDAYCRDISIKVRSQLDVKRRNGKFIGSFAGYGYLKDPADKNHLVVDEYAAEIVKLIFELKMDGMSVPRIAEKLTAMGVLPPLEYKRKLGMNFNSGFRSGPETKWSDASVRRILKNQMYTGTMVQGKRKKINYKVKQCRDIAEENWICVKNTHEAIISEGMFRRVQEIMRMDTRTPPEEETVHLMSGVLHCGDCGQNMVRRCSRRNGKAYFYYHCSTYKNGLGCSAHLISEEKLVRSTLHAVRKQVDMLVRAEELIRRFQEGVVPEERYRVKTLRKQLIVLGAEIEHYKDLKTRLYQDMQDGLIGREEFKEINERFSRKVSSARGSEKELLDQLEKVRREEMEFQPWLEEFKARHNIEVLDRKTVVSLIERIDIFSKDKVEIHFRFEDEIRNVMESIEYYGAKEGTE